MSRDLSEYDPHKSTGSALAHVRNAIGRLEDVINNPYYIRYKSRAGAYRPKYVATEYSRQPDAEEMREACRRALEHLEPWRKL